MTAAPPPDAIRLFDGTNLDAWTLRDGKTGAPWPIEADGAMISRGGDIVTRERFTDFQLHVEFCCEDAPPHVKGQGRSNSGVFLQGRYEIQVLDSYGIPGPPGLGDCGALYNQSAPLVNASLPPMEWQTYDIVFRAPRFDTSPPPPQSTPKPALTPTEPARVTVWQNGCVIHNNVALPMQTGAAVDEHYDQPGPILLQDHGNDVRFRNVWILPLRERGAAHYSGAEGAGVWQNLVRPTLVMVRRWVFARSTVS